MNFKHILCAIIASFTSSMSAMELKVFSYYGTIKSYQTKEKDHHDVLDPIGLKKIVRTRDTGNQNLFKDIACKIMNYVLYGDCYKVQNIVAKYSAQQMQPIKKLKISFGDRISSIAWNPDNIRLAVGSRDKITIWDIISKELWKTFKWNNALIIALAWDPHDIYLAAIADQSIGARIWDTTTGLLAFILAGHTDRIYSIAWSPDGTYLATGSKDNTARIWNPHTGQLLKTLTFSNKIYSVCWKPNGNCLAIADTYLRAIYLWHQDTDTLTKLEKTFYDSIYTISFSPDGQNIYISQDYHNKKTLSYNVDGKYIAVPWYGTWKIVDAHTKQTLLSFKDDLACWSPNGKYFTTAAPFRDIYIWDVSAFEYYKNQLATLTQEQNLLVYAINKTLERGDKVYKLDTASQEYALFETLPNNIKNALLPYIRYKSHWYYPLLSLIHRLRII